jgi:hypothetical protein
MYKVYVKLDDKAPLMSPYHYKLNGGEIFGPGTFKAEIISPTTLAFDSLLFNDPWNLPEKSPKPRTIPIDNIPEFCDGAAMEISGFHCIPSKEEAEIYRKYIHNILKSRADGVLPEGFITVVIPVNVKKEHIIAYGTTPMYDEPEEPLRQIRKIETYVTKEITITPEAIGFNPEKFLGFPNWTEGLTNWTEELKDDDIIV